MREEELMESGWYFQVGDKVQVSLDHAFVSFNSNLQPHGHCIVAKYPFIVQMSWKDGIVHGQIVVANLRTQSLLGVYIVNRGIVVHSKDMSSLSEEILDNCNTGERWDGTVCGDSPCGWGCFYDENNQLVYEGFRLSSCDVCYGVYYHSPLGTQIVFYEGMIYNGKHFGMGRFFNRRGEKEYEGEWINDSNLFSESCRLMPEDRELTNLTSLTNQIDFDSYSGAHFHSIQFQNIWRLKQIIIGDYCMISSESGTNQNPLSLSLIDLPNLHLLQIGNNSLTKYNEFSISRCPQLDHIVVGNTAFVNCSRFSIESREVFGLSSRFTPVRSSKHWFWFICMCNYRFI